MRLMSSFAEKSLRSWKRLVPAMLLTSCLIFLTACPKSTVHKSREAVADIASGLQAVQQLNEDLYHSKLITASEGTAIASFVVQATYLNDHAHACVSNLSDNIQAIAGCVAPYVDQLKGAEAVTLLKINNPRARLKFETALKGIDTGLAVLQSILGQAPVTSGTTGD